MQALVIQNNVMKDQAASFSLSLGLHLNEGGVIPATGVVLRVKLRPPEDGDRIIGIKAGDRQVFIVVPCALSHSQVTHDIDRRTVLCHVDRLGQRGVGLILRTGIAVAAVAADIDCRARTSGGKGCCGQKPEHQHKCHQR